MLRRVCHTVICHVAASVSSKGTKQQHQTWTAEWTKLSCVFTETLTVFFSHRCCSGSAVLVQGPPLPGAGRRLGEGPRSLQGGAPKSPWHGWRYDKHTQCQPIMMMKIYLHPSFSGAWNNKLWLNGRFIFPVALGLQLLLSNTGVVATDCRTESRVVVNIVALSYNWGDNVLRIKSLFHVTTR